MFLKLSASLSGAVAERFLGEAKDAEYRNQIEINDWTWRLEPPSSSSSGGSGASTAQTENFGEPSVLTFNKAMCRATAGMLGAMRRGEFLHAVFSLEEDSDVDFLLTLTLRNVRIISYEFDISGIEVKEKWTFDYKSIEFNYRNNYADVNGDLSVELFRSPGASTSSVPANKGKILELARKLTRGELGDLAKTLEEMSMKQESLHTEKSGPGIKG